MTLKLLIQPNFVNKTVDNMENVLKVNVSSFRGRECKRWGGGVGINGTRGEGEHCMQIEGMKRNTLIFSCHETGL